MIAWQLLDNCLIIWWRLADDWLMTLDLIPINYLNWFVWIQSKMDDKWDRFLTIWQLPGNCLLTAYNWLMSAWWLPDDYLITHLWLPGLQSCLQFSCTHPKKNSFKILKTSSFYLTEGQPCIWYKVAKHQKEDSDVISCEELSSLKSLDLRRNRLTSLAEFRIPALKELYLSGNNSKMGPKSFWKYQNRHFWQNFSFWG